jgi:hypothetical protein
MAYNAGSDPTLAEHITSKFVPEIFSKEVLLTAKPNLVCTSRFDTHWLENLRKGYKVSIPAMTGASCTEVTPGTEPTAADLRGTAVAITVDKWQESSAEISEMIGIEMLADYYAAAAEECGVAIAKAVDLDVSSLFSTLAASSVYGSDGQTFDDAIFQALVQYLDEQDVPDDGLRSLIGDPSTRIDIYNVDKFIRTDYVREASVPTGKIGQLYNCGVFITNNLTASTTGNYGVLAHKKAIGVAIQKEPRTRYFDLGYKFINKVIVDCIWGADEVRDTFGKSFYTRSK